LNPIDKPSGPEVGFEDITIDLPEARFWVACDICPTCFSFLDGHFDESQAFPQFRIESFRRAGSGVPVQLEMEKAFSQ